jgi:hypothetical protein
MSSETMSLGDPLAIPDRSADPKIYVEEDHPGIAGGSPACANSPDPRSVGDLTRLKCRPSRSRAAITVCSQDVKGPMDTGGGFAAGRNLQAVQYVVDVILDSRSAERETSRDLLVRETLVDQPNDLLLASS